MKRKSLKTVLIALLFTLFSCQETVVTNIVHPDGSITRRIVIKDPDSKGFKAEDYRVPFDETWKIRDTFELNDKGDTTHIRTAEKLFRNVAEINKEYSNDKGSNRDFPREARFNKKFRWFSTLYTFSENIDKTLFYGFPIEQYLNKKELEFYFLPENIQTDRRNGADSTMVKQIEDSVRIKSDKWLLMSYISEWKEELLKLSEKSGKGTLRREFFRDKDSVIINMLEISEKDTAKSNFDTVFIKIMNNVFGDKLYLSYKTEIDSSVKILEKRFEKANNFAGYTVRTQMPGKIVATNGFIDQNNEMVWPVKNEYFLTQPYRMWAESKTTNTWAWIVSGVFVLFVVVGLVVRGTRNNNALP